MNNEQQYWFPTKRYGWGWGVPRMWQGWAVLAAYAALLRKSSTGGLMPGSHSWGC